jgi:hypothetical protein
LNIINKEIEWTGHLDITCRCFRLGMEAAGNESLMRFIDKITPTLTKLQPETVKRLEGLLKESLSAQARHDNSFLADILEHEIRPLLEAASNQLKG